jgi:hypothetical protein
MDAPRPAAKSRKWLRRLHAWCGAALAALALLFAVTGFLLNHRAVMKIPALDRREAVEVVSLPAPPADPRALAEALAPALGIAPAALSPRIEPERAVEWDGRILRQPPRWTLVADTPSRAIRIEHWTGSRQAEIRLARPNLGLHLARLHMAIGTGPGWILLADAAALGLAFLALSGFWMWGRLHGPAVRLALLASGGLTLATALAWLAG